MFDIFSNIYSNEPKKKSRLTYMTSHVLNDFYYKYNVKKKKKKKRIIGTRNRS